jgi:hypothetical protein
LDLGTPAHHLPWASLLAALLPARFRGQVFLGFKLAAKLAGLGFAFWD